MRRWVSLVGMSMVGLVAVAGCGGSSSGASASSAAGGNAITIKNFAFSPNPLRVKVGTTVTFTNDDSTTHTATDPGTFDSKDLSQHQTFSYTFNTPGDYHFICSIHQYMKGEIIVGS